MFGRDVFLDGAAIHENAPDRNLQEQVVLLKNREERSIGNPSIRELLAVGALFALAGVGFFAFRAELGFTYIGTVAPFALFVYSIPFFLIFLFLSGQQASLRDEIY